MKKILIFLTAFLIIPLGADAKSVTINLFYGQECPHCEEEQEYLEQIKDRYGDNVDIKKYEVWHNTSNDKLLTKVREVLKNDDKGVPYTVIGDTGLTGYNDNVASQITKLIAQNLKDPTIDVVSYVEQGKEISVAENEKKIEDSFVSVPIIGEVDAKNVSLPLVAAVLGLVDGFNPCAMWVLLFLISMLIGMKNKKRMWILGLTFLVTSALVYLLFMVAWLQIAVTALQQVVLRTLIAIVAIIGGALNLRTYLKSLEDPSGCTVVSDKKRQKMFAKIKKFTHEKSFLLAILGVITLAFSVNLVELACSAGLPLLFTSILAMNELTGLAYAINILIYILFFLIDDIIVFVIAMKTLEVTGISTKYSKYAHLIGGIIMLIIGVLLIFKPEWIMFNF